MTTINHLNLDLDGDGIVERYDLPRGIDPRVIAEEWSNISGRALEGEYYIHNGKLWHAINDTYDEPSDDSDDWTSTDVGYELEGLTAACNNIAAINEELVPYTISQMAITGLDGGSMELYIWDESVRYDQGDIVLLMSTINDLQVIESVWRCLKSNTNVRPEKGEYWEYESALKTIHDIGGVKLGKDENGNSGYYNNDGALTIFSEDGNTFTGTKEEVDAAIAAGEIEEGTIVNITNDYSPGGGGGLLPQLIIITDSDCIVEVSKDSKKLKPTLIEENKWKCEVDSFGIWTITLIKDTAIKSLNVNIDAVKVYTIKALIDGYVEWLNLAGIIDTFGSLEAVLNDELTVRTLMTKHASADYLLEWYGQDASVIDSFIASEYAMKWIGLRDYICDKLMANETWQTAMLESDNWEYILKDHVPVMTSDTAPYGSTIGDSGMSNKYKAFDGDDSSYAGLSSGKTTTWIGYKFPNPICVKSAYVYVTTTATCKGFLEYSNDGSTWVTVGEAFDVGGTIRQRRAFENNIYALNWRVRYTDTAGRLFNTPTLQFYGRSLDVSVPVMTSNTAPWGEAIADSEFASNYMAFNAFNKSTSSYWASKNQTNAYVGYDFKKSIKVKAFSFVNSYELNKYRIKNYKIQGSTNGASWVDLYTGVAPQNTSVQTIPIDNDAEYMQYRMMIADGYTASAIEVDELNFYGVDYSEREDRRYIYDHGLELEELVVDKVTSNYSIGTIQKNSDSIVLSVQGNANSLFVHANNKIDLNGKNYVFARAEKNTNNTNKCDICISSTIYSKNNVISSIGIDYGKSKDMITGVNVSSINNDNYIGFELYTSASTNATDATLYELWLE